MYTVKEFLEAVRQGLKQDNIREADRVVRIVAGALKGGLPHDSQTALGRLLPQEMSSAWEDIQPTAPDFLELEELYIEEGPPETEPSTCSELTGSEKAASKA